MFGLSAAVRVYFATEPADMRKSFDGLAALASGRLALDPLSGHLFVFVNVAIHRCNCDCGAVSCARTDTASNEGRFVLRGRIPQLYPLRAA